jgi:hypothetical protein
VVSIVHKSSLKPFSFQSCNVKMLIIYKRN